MTAVEPEVVQITPAGASRETFLAARSQGLGSSDVAALIGADKYRTALSVYLDKTGADREREEDDETSDGFMADARYWGTVLEGPVAEHFSRRMGRPIVEAGTYARHGWQIASADRLLLASPLGDSAVVLPYARYVPGDVAGELVLVETEVEVDGGYEGKTASAYLSDEWAGGLVPDRYLVQTYWQMHVLGLPYVWIAALIGGQKYVQVKVERDQPFIDDLVSLAARFWFENVAARIPPPLLGEPVSAALDLIKSLHPVSIEGSEIELDPTVEYWITRQQEHKAWERAHKDAAAAYEVLIREALGDYEIGRVGGRQVLKATNIAGSTFTVVRKPGRRLYPARDLKPAKIELPIEATPPTLAGPGEDNPKEINS